MTPKQVGIFAAMAAIDDAIDDIEDTTELGKPAKRGAIKELKLIYNRLNKRLPENLQRQDMET